VNTGKPACHVDWAPGVDGSARGVWVTVTTERMLTADRRPVLEKTLERMPVTIGLNILSEIFVFSIAIPIGIVAAVRKGSLFDKASTVGVFFFFSVPTFWLALLAMILFGVKLGWLPISGLRSFDHDLLGFWGRVGDLARHLVLPVVIGSIGGLAGISRFMRSGMLEVSARLFRTARAKGARAGDLAPPLQRGAPIITISAPVPAIAGSVIFETIFAIPGRQLMWQAMARLPVILGGWHLGVCWS
jgi:peptide/nickel transport system permease protein